MTSPLSQENNARDLELVSVSEKLKEDDSQINKSQESLRSLIFSAMYICLVAWFATLHVRVGAFISLFNGWVTQLVEGQVSKGKSNTLKLLNMKQKIYNVSSSFHVFFFFFFFFLGGGGGGGETPRYMQSILNALTVFMVLV